MPAKPASQDHLSAWHLRLKFSRINLKRSPSLRSRKSIILPQKAGSRSWDSESGAAGSVERPKFACVLIRHKRSSTKDNRQDCPGISSSVFMLCAFLSLDFLSRQKDQISRGSTGREKRSRWERMCQRMNLKLKLKDFSSLSKSFQKAGRSQRKELIFYLK